MKNGFALLMFAIFCARSFGDVTIDVDASKPIGPISPLIYGMNFPSFDRMPFVTFARQGGNRFSAWNWETNASNAGNDFRFQSDAYLGGGDVPGEVARAFVAPAMTRGKSVLVTVPMLGYVAADKKGNGDVSQTPDFIHARFLESLPRKNPPFSDPPDVKDRRVFQDEFVWWLEKHFPVEARNGATIFYSLDNEPDLWASTHAKIHPQPLTYAEIISKTHDYASAIKDVAPHAIIFGPASYGWNGFVSLQHAPDAGDRDFLEFYLDAMREFESREHRRLIDVLDVHWYPEARGGTHRITDRANDPETSAARVQAPRSLWDDSYVENSWVAKYATNGPIQLLPRLREKIDRHYSGTKLAISEYDFGGVDDISGAIAEADALGAFGNAGVFAACHWGNSGTFLRAAYLSFLNFDGGGASFGDVSLGVHSSNIAAVSVYASAFTLDQNKVVLILINRDAQSQTCVLKLNEISFSSAIAFEVSRDHSTPVRIENPLHENKIDLPAMTITTLLLQR